MKLIVNDRHIKTIPMQFSAIPDIENHLEDFDRKRLTESERIVLKEQLRIIRFNAELSLFLSDLKRDNPNVFSLIDNSELRFVNRVNTKHGHYYSITFSNRLEIRRPEVLFDEAGRNHKAIVTRLY